MRAPTLLPGPRATKALEEAHRRLLCLARASDNQLPPAIARDEATNVALLVAAALPDVAALISYVDRQEENLREMSQESNESQREITRLRTMLADVQRTVERAMRDTAPELDRITHLFNELRKLNAYLVDAAQPAGVVRADAPPNAPRAAAGGL